MTFLFSIGAGGGTVAGGYWWLSQRGLLPDSFPAGDQEFMVWILFLVGAFMGGMLGALVRIRAGRSKSRDRGVTFRNYNDFPPISALRERGWDWPSSE